MQSNNLQGLQFRILSTKVNKLSTKRRDSRMNHKGFLTAEEQKSSKGATIIETVSVETEASVIGGKLE